MAHKKNCAAFDDVIKNKFNGNLEAADDLSRQASTSELKICVVCKKRPNDDAVPTTKKPLLERWNNTKGREVLSNYEYLTLFGNTTSEIIRLLLDENSDVGDDNDPKVQFGDVGVDASVAL